MLKYIVGTAALEANRPQVTIDTYLTNPQDSIERFYAQPTGHWYIGNLAEAYHMSVNMRRSSKRSTKPKNIFAITWPSRPMKSGRWSHWGEPDEIAAAVEESLASASAAGTAGEVMLEAAASLRPRMKDWSRVYAQKACSMVQGQGGQGRRERGEAKGVARALYAAERWGRGPDDLQRAVHEKTGESRLSRPTWNAGRQARRPGGGPADLEKLKAVDRYVSLRQSSLLPRLRRVDPRRARPGDIAAQGIVRARAPLRPRSIAIRTSNRCGIMRRSRSSSGPSQQEEVPSHRTSPTLHTLEEARAAGPPCRSWSFAMTGRRQPLKTTPPESLMLCPVKSSQLRWSAMTGCGAFPKNAASPAGCPPINSGVYKTGSLLKPSTLS